MARHSRAIIDDAEDAEATILRDLIGDEI